MSSEIVDAVIAAEISYFFFTKCSIDLSVFVITSTCPSRHYVKEVGVSRGIIECLQEISTIYLIFLRFKSKKRKPPA